MMHVRAVEDWVCHGHGDPDRTISIESKSVGQKNIVNALKTLKCQMNNNDLMALIYTLFITWQLPLLGS